MIEWNRQVPQRPGYQFLGGRRMVPGADAMDGGPCSEQTRGNGQRGQEDEEHHQTPSRTPEAAMIREALWSFHSWWPASLNLSNILSIQDSHYPKSISWEGVTGVALEWN